MRQNATSHQRSERNTHTKRHVNKCECEDKTKKENETAHRPSQEKCAVCSIRVLIWFFRGLMIFWQAVGWGGTALAVNDTLPQIGARGQALSNNKRTNVWNFLYLPILPLSHSLPLGQAYLSAQHRKRHFLVVKHNLFFSHPQLSCQWWVIYGNRAG